MDHFQDLCKTFNDEHPKGMKEDDKHRLWAEAGGEYGQGSLKKESNYRNPGVLHSQALSTNVDSNQLRELRKSIVDDLRKSMEEGLRRSITENVQKTMDDKFQQLIAQMAYDPLLQTDNPLMTLLNSSPNPVGTPVQIDSLADTSGYRSFHPTSGYN
ncbi:hypothetical protein V2J09_018050 [Rumex salicifolius]